jgi:hypothetical protein
LVLQKHMDGASIVARHTMANRLATLAGDAGIAPLPFVAKRSLGKADISPKPNRRWAHRFDVDPGLRSAHFRLKKVNV